MEPDDEDPGGTSEECGTEERRTLRIEYRSLQQSLTAEADKQAFVNGNFNILVGQIENLHDKVSRPREQVSDAETLLQFTSSLLASAKSAEDENGKVSPGQFVNALLASFPGNGDKKIDWEALGDASGIFGEAPGVTTMLGPLDIQPKQRKVAERRRKEKRAEASRPEEVEDVADDVNAEVEKNMKEMFGILREQKCVKLEALVLNRISFAQSVENIFALSFLVKDGRAEIKIADDGTHLVVPRNAPTAGQRQNGTVVNTQFVFRFDYKDWKFMQQEVEAGEELMKHRVPEVRKEKAASKKRCVDLPAAKPDKKKARRQGVHKEFLASTSGKNPSDQDDDINGRPSQGVELEAQEKLIEEGMKTPTQEDAPSPADLPRRRRSEISSPETVEDASRSLSTRRRRLVQNGRMV